MTFQVYENAFEAKGDVNVTADNWGEFDVAVHGDRVYVGVDCGGEERAAVSFTHEQWAQVVAKIKGFTDV